MAGCLLLLLELLLSHPLNVGCRLDRLLLLLFLMLLLQLW
jgi:hypothetical protein